MAKKSSSPADRPKPIERRSRVTVVGGFKRTALFALGGLLLIATGAGCFVGSLLIRPSSRAGAVLSQDMLIDPNNLLASKAEFTVDHRAGARYDLYLTLEERDPSAGDYVQFDVKALRPGSSSSRYVTYAYIYFGDDVVRTHRDDGIRYETYEMERNVHVSSRSETIRMEFTATAAWFQGSQPGPATVDLVEITPMDRLLMLSRSVLQVATFPVAFLGVVLLWLAIMRQLRLVGVRVSPPPARKYEAPAGRKQRAQEALQAEGGPP